MNALISLPKSACIIHIMLECFCNPYLQNAGDPAQRLKQNKSVLNYIMVYPFKDTKIMRCRTYPIMEIMNVSS